MTDPLEERVMSQANLEEIILANAKENIRLLSEIDDLEAKLSKMAEVMLTASKRVRKGLSGPPLHFRCAHCGGSSPIIINSTLALAHEAMMSERSK